MPAIALAQNDDPPAAVVDVVEIAGPIDRPIERYLLERIDEAEREGVALVVFQVDSLGGMKIVADGLPPVVEAIRDAAVPTAVFIGPRQARAAGAVLYMAAAADFAVVGPSSLIGPANPVDHAHPGSGDAEALAALARANDRTVAPDAAAGVFRASAAVEAGLADQALPSIRLLLESADGEGVETSAGSVVLNLPSDDVDVRFFQPGPIRRFLHTLSNPTLVYLLLIASALLLLFELFQPGFGVAGVTGALVLAAASYGITVLPVRGWGLGLLVGGMLLLTLDVAMDALGVPTVVGTGALLAGSLLLYPNTSEAAGLSAWLVGFGVASSLIVAVPVMTVVRRARKPIATQVRRQLIGEGGQVRSVLNPEGFVDVGGEVWRARSQDGTRLRVGEPVVVSAVDGTVLIVQGGPPA
jgi:membrane-bound serine protease (ClpP class)